ncbi:predicted protein [Uncinocarpus reesii 1704]|uniref:MINDY deubiquitinase domain-containing protein n=1 Tax=Uncinocarpus reesii (strain UAMH 1704) TaxID=336963 RepID=C4JMF7_UNCRE|nr:uncharacterized protein UREG_04015 [Uncinocarpus reesii 1704]EEP79169.1 predicted protein [Uncinocarpus reesii 1704]
MGIKQCENTGIAGQEDQDVLPGSAELKIEPIPDLETAADTTPSNQSSSVSSKPAVADFQMRQLDTNQESLTQDQPAGSGELCDSPLLEAYDNRGQGIPRPKTPNAQSSNHYQPNPDAVQISPPLDSSVLTPSPSQNSAGSPFHSLPPGPVASTNVSSFGAEDQLKLEATGYEDQPVAGVTENDRSNDYQSPTCNSHSSSLLPSQDLMDLEETEHRDSHHVTPHFPAPQSHLSTTQPTRSCPLDPQDEPTRSQGDRSEAPSVKPQAQRSEIYGIRVVNWIDGVHSPLRHSPVLIQNENGPCPLLALVNSLVMRTPPDIQSPLIRALKSRESISLGLLIQALFDELTTYVDEEYQLPDIEDLSKFLTMLHTGMNVNPRLTPNVNPDQPGMFHQTRDIQLYSAFNLPLVHGWLAPPSSEAHKAMLRTAEYHDDIQLLHFRKEELEGRVLTGGMLQAEEERLVKDIDHIQRFVNVENPTQLSTFGLEHLNRSLEPGAVCILFRNDHFSTLFKHPQSHQLFTLVTDAGYASHAEVVWESLVDVNGSGSELFSGDFRPVGAAPSLPNNQQKDQSAAEQNRNLDAGQSSTHNEQTDADYAYALALQYQDEEEQRTRTERRSSRSQNEPPWQQVPSRHRSASNITPQTHRQSTGHRQPRQSQVVRPLIPQPPEIPISPDSLSGY